MTGAEEIAVILAGLGVGVLGAGLAYVWGASIALIRGALTQ